MKQGCLFLVVGPSGAGKDSLLDGARDHFKKDRRIVFPRRHITRDKDAGGEDHIAMTLKDFQRREREGGFALSWGAHNLLYGIDKSVEDDLSNGINVVINVSRSVIDQALATYETVKVLSIHVDQDVLKERLLKRGRESQADIDRRLQRAHAFSVEGPHVIKIDNSTGLSKAQSAFINAIRPPL